MAGMKFLNLKGWHPSNARNQKRLWIAEQKAKDTQQREQDAAEEVRKSAETQHFQELSAAKGDAESARRSQQMQVGFMYAPPPGLQKVDESVTQSMTEDDAVREFRRKMEKRTAPASGDDVQRPLERYVGRRPDEMLTIKDQVERFPFLKDAPVEGDYAANVKVNFKPMGRQVRNVKCMRCGEWGHASGDRECALRDANPHDAARLVMEDPMTQVAKLHADMKKQQRLVLKKTALPLEMQTDSAQKPEFEILLSDDDAPNPEKAFLASLSTKEKRRLLKKLRRQTEKENESDDSSRSSDSSGDDDARRRQSKKKRKSSKSRRARSPERRRSIHRRHDRGHERDDRDSQRRERRVRSLSVERDDEKQARRSTRSRSSSRSKRNRPRVEDDGEPRYRNKSRRSRSRGRDRGHHSSRRR